MENPVENGESVVSIVELNTLLETERRARTAAEAEVAKRGAVITEINAVAGAARQSLNAALAAYKALVVRSNPVVFAELISGDSFEAINNSLESAKALISKVRQSVEAEIAAGKVPAGAPARTVPDLENLSSREKIQYAISKGGKN